MKNLIKTHWLILIVFTSVTVFCSQRGLSFIILLVAFPTLLYQAIQCLRFWQLPEKRAVHLTAIVIVITSLLIVYSIHIYRDYTARTNADQIVQTIEKFRLDNNRYPTTLDELGIDSAKALHSYGLYYDATQSSNSIPILSYDSTFELGDYWIYGFSTHQWRYMAP
jgi:hypothetical protein